MCFVVLNKDIWKIHATHQLNIINAISHLTCVWSDPDCLSSVEEENTSSTQEAQI